MLATYTPDFSPVWANFGYLLAGLGTTLAVSALAILLGLTIGILTALARTARVVVLRFAGAGYVEMFRMTPLVVQLFVLAFGIPSLGIVEITPLQAGVIGLGLNSGAYCAEILRAGIINIPPGQTAAARSLGFSETATFRHVIFPQALRAVMPPLGTQFLDTTLSSSFLGVIGAQELTDRANELAFQTYRPIEVFAVTAIMYLVVSVLLGRTFALIEPIVNRRRVRSRVSATKVLGFLRGVR